MKFCVFDIFFKLKKKIGVILALFKNFESQTRKKQLKKYFVNVSYISILHPSKGLYSSYSKKKSNSLYPSGHPSVAVTVRHKKGQDVSGV